MTRPAGTPRLATDANYPASANPWSLTPTKVTPTTGKLAMGDEPTEYPPAQFRNYKDNRIGEFLNYLDASDCHNFPKVTPAGTVVSAGAVSDMCYSPGEGKFYAISATQAPANALSESGTDENFSTVAGPAGAGGPARASVAIRTSDSHLVTCGRTSVNQREAGVWTSNTAVASTELVKVIYDSVDDVFWIGGADTGATRPQLFQLGNTIGTLAAVTLTGAVAGDGMIGQIAISPSKKLALAYDATASYLWTGTTVGAWSQVTPTFTADNPSGMIYSAALGLFVVTTANGKTYTSADGTTWTLRSTNASWAFERYGLVAKGPFLVSAVTVDTRIRLAWSADQGVTWNLEMPPMNTFGCLSVLDDRLCWAGTEATPLTRLAYGLRLKA